MNKNRLIRKKKTFFDIQLRKKKSFSLFCLFVFYLFIFRLRCAVTTELSHRTTNSGASISVSNPYVYSQCLRWCWASGLPLKAPETVGTGERINCYLLTLTFLHVTRTLYIGPHWCFHTGFFLFFVILVLNASGNYTVFIINCCTTEYIQNSSAEYISTYYHVLRFIYC